MNDLKKNIRRIFWLYFGLFLILVLYLGNFIINSHDVINSTYNPRLNMNDNKIKRGAIYDAKGNILAESVLEDGAYKRVYPYDNMFAHTAGSIGRTKAGAEAEYNFNLSSLDFEVLQRIMNLASGQPLEGDSIHLTLDLELQNLVYEQLGTAKGGVVVMEPKTGKILSMVSYPAYNPNTLSQKWEELSEDTKNSPLLNRATQGLYPPGSIYKIITAGAALDNISDIQDFYYHCQGYADFGDNRIRCYDQTAHGTINIEEAFRVSCNTFFAQAAMEIGPEILKQYSEKAMFNGRYEFDLEYLSSRFSLGSDATEFEIIQTSIGQGKTLVTPLHMAMLVSAVANDGKMMKPYVCEKVTSKWGYTKTTNKPEAIAQVFSKERAAQLKVMMTDVVDTGTGKQASISGIKIAGKTGTAENASGSDHGWFIAFAPAEDPKIAVAVLTENSDGTKKALAISKSIFSYMLQE